MKYIKFFEGFDSKYPIDKIEIDIDGMLIELIDNNFSIKKDFTNSYISISISKKVNFKYDEIKDYVDTMLDYLNNALGDDISIEFKTDTIYEIYRKEHYLTKNDEPYANSQINLIKIKVDYEIH